MPSPARPGSPPINQMVPSLPGGSVPRAPPGMRRTDEIAKFSLFSLSGAASSRAQQAAMRVIGVLRSGSAQFKDALAQGMKEAGYIEGQNVRVEYRWAGAPTTVCPGMADDKWTGTLTGEAQRDPIQGVHQAAGSGHAPCQSTPHDGPNT